MESLSQSRIGFPLPQLVETSNLPKSPIHCLLLTLENLKTLYQLCKFPRSNENTISTDDEVGWRCLGAPVHDAAGRPIVAAVSITGTIHRLRAENIALPPELTGDHRGHGAVLEDPGALFFALSEEHGHLDTAASAHPYRLEDRLRIVPNHVCTTINRHDRIDGIRKSIVETIWHVAVRVQEPFPYRGPSWMSIWSA